MWQPFLVRAFAFEALEKPRVQLAPELTEEQRLKNHLHTLKHCKDDLNRSKSTPTSIEILKHA